MLTEVNEKLTLVLISSVQFSKNRLLLTVPQNWRGFVTLQKRRTVVNTRSRIRSIRYFRLLLLFLGSVELSETAAERPVLPTAFTARSLSGVSVEAGSFRSAAGGES